MLFRSLYTSDTAQLRELHHPAKSTPHLSWLAAYDNCRNVDSRSCLFDFPLTWWYFGGVMGVERFTTTEKVSTQVTAVVGQVIDAVAAVL